jgi:hypothetical protein
VELTDAAVGALALFGEKAGFLVGMAESLALRTM